MKLATSVSLGVGILAVPERRTRVDQLLKKLGLSEAAVAWDHNHDGHLPTWWRAIKLASSSHPSHVLLLEDDAEPCKDFIPAIQKLVETYPDRIISLFTTQEPPTLQTGHITLVPHNGFSDVAVVYPLAWLEGLRRDFAIWQQESGNVEWSTNHGADELRMKLRPLQKSWNTLPSLVQHGCPTQSTLGHNFAHSRARLCLEQYTSALSLDWSQL